MPATTHYTDDTAVTARAAETPLADFENGMNAGGSNAPGIGINIAGGAVDGDPSNFTLLDQDGDSRDPQNSQQIGGEAIEGGISGKGVQPILTATTQTNAAKEGDPALDGVPVITGDANLETLNAGWVDAVA